MTTEELVAKFKAVSDANRVLNEEIESMREQFVKMQDIIFFYEHELRKRDSQNKFLLEFNRMYAEMSDKYSEHGEGCNG